MVELDLDRRKRKSMCPKALLNSRAIGDSDADVIPWKQMRGVRIKLSLTWMDGKGKVCVLKRYNVVGR